MGLPSRAVFVDEPAPGIAVWDVSHLLPNDPRNDYRRRPVAAIRFEIVHKSGADGPPGFEGAKATARFVVHHRGWPAAAYHLWLPRVPDRDGDGRLVIYMLNADDVHSYHTGGQRNHDGYSIALQGRFDGQWDLIGDEDDADPRIEREPTPEQWEMLEAVIPWLRERHDVDLGETGNGWGLTGHWEHGKPVCPGDAIRAWIIRYRQGIEPEAGLEPDADELAAGRERAAEVEAWGGRCPTPREVQRALEALGHDPGPIDGIWGFRSRAALERFQAEAGLRPDGWMGPRTSRALREAVAASSEPTDPAEGDAGDSAAEAGGAPETPPELEAAIRKAARGSGSLGRTPDRRPPGDAVDDDDDDDGGDGE